MQQSFRLNSDICVKNAIKQRLLRLKRHPYINILFIGVPWSRKNYYKGLSKVQRLGITALRHRGSLPRLELHVVTTAV